jgi:ATP-dependent DNA ligase
MPSSFRYIPAMSCPFAFIEPCLPTLRPSPPVGDAFVHEAKFDGHRLQIHKQVRAARLFR